MKPEAVAQAKDSLAFARESVDAMRASKTFRQFKKAWREYLLAFYEIYEKLKKGSEGKNGRSRTWYHGVKVVRQKDELLTYLYQARAEETHGLEPSARMDGPHLETLRDPNATISQDRKGKELNIRVATKSGQPWALKMTMPTRVRLIPVTDTRFGKMKTFPTPTMHLGQKLPSINIPDAAELALKCLDGIVDEASTLPK